MSSSTAETSGRVADTGTLELVNAPHAFWRGLGTDVRGVWQFRELLGNLIRRELKVRYKDSVLGFFWSFLRPLLQLLVYSVAIGVFLGAGKSIPEFGVYIFTGLLAWTLFADIISGATGSIVGNGGLIKKVYFPREIFPLSVAGSALVNGLIQSLVLVAAYVVTGKWPSPRNLPLVLLAIFVLVLYAVSIGLVLAAANVYLRDVQYLVEVGLMLWFWSTPVVYAWTTVRDSLSAHPALFQAYMLNPMANVVLAFQRALWPAGKGTPFIYSGNLYLRLSLLAVVGIVLLWLAQRLFSRMQGSFAQEL